MEVILDGIGLSMGICRSAEVSCVEAVCMKEEG